MGNVTGKAEISAELLPFCGFNERVLQHVWRGFVQASSCWVEMDMDMLLKVFQDTFGNTLDKALKEILAKSSAAGFIHFRRIFSVLIFLSSMPIPKRVYWLSLLFQIETPQRIYHEECHCFLKHSLEILCQLRETSSPLTPLPNVLGGLPDNYVFLQKRLEMIINDLPFQRGKGRLYLEKKDFVRLVLQHPVLSSWLEHFHRIETYQPSSVVRGFHLMPQSSPLCSTSPSTPSTWKCQGALNEFLRSTIGMLRSVSANLNGPRSVSSTLLNDSPRLETRAVVGWSPSESGNCAFFDMDDEVVFPAASIVVVLDARLGRQKFLEGHKGPISSIAIHSNLSLIASCEEVQNASRIIIWKKQIPNSFSKTQMVKLGACNIGQLCFSAQGSFLLAIENVSKASAIISLVVTLNLEGHRTLLLVSFFWTGKAELSTTLPWDLHLG